MGTQITKSLKGRRIRVTRLDTAGAPVVGSCSSVVTDGFITVTVSEELEAGEEYLQKNAWGDFCINEKDGDRAKWANVSLEMCEVHPDILDIVAAGNPVVDTTPDTIGATFGTDANDSAFAIEVWTKQAGEGGATPDWGYLVVPFCKNGKIDGDVTVENGTLTISFMGEGNPATSDWATTPYGDNPLIAAAGFPVGDLWGLVRTTVQPPALTSGCAAVS